MVALFAVGVMSIGWMIFISVIVAAEKLLPFRRASSYVAALVLIVLGLGVGLSPIDVPGLTLPGSSHARHAMQHMGMGPHRPAMGTGSGSAMPHQH
jgi:cytochrome c biogenesis protein CcdA